ncbi:peroxiredoxin [Aureimonas sp. AU4]|uniref:peroxiredoxin n=1 Tax=Aureimonas sp. AU4 TaxID=1638163 RepID=UPI00078311FA|nr:peroxiredoxin [Aureimonas sp. AU4]
MTIMPGETIPAVNFRSPGPDGPTTITSADVFSGKKVVLFAVPGAFTPTCTMNHLPGYLEHERELRERGVDTIAVTAVNDVHVMRAWAEATGAADRILFLADGNAEFARAVGLEMDMSGGGMGTRSKRYSMLIENGVVRALNVEESPGRADTSSAAAMLESL